MNFNLPKHFSFPRLVSLFVRVLWEGVRPKKMSKVSFMCSSFSENIKQAENQNFFSSNFHSWWFLEQHKARESEGERWSLTSEKGKKMLYKLRPFFSRSFFNDSSYYDWNKARGEGIFHVSPSPFLLFLLLAITQFIRVLRGQWKSLCDEIRNTQDANVTFKRNYKFGKQKTDTIHEMK